MEELRKKLDDFENRLKKIEEFLFSNQTKIENDVSKDYKGLVGGIRFLIGSGFLNQPKSVNEIREELKKESYHYTTAGIACTLSETFTKSQKILNRIKEDKIYKYVVRK
jgi:hypothetical protein